MILLTSPTSSFEVAKVICFPPLTTPTPHVAIASLTHIYLWVEISIANTDAIVADDTKNFLAKETLTFISGPFNLPNKAPLNPPDRMILDNWALLSFISVNILLAKAFISYFFVLLLEIIHEAILFLESFS